MRFKRSCGSIFGVEFTKKEQKIIDEKVREMAREAEAEYMEEFESNIDAQLLWFMHKHEGHGKKRLIDDFHAFAPYIGELTEYYEMPESEGSFIAKQKLKDIGVDIDELRKDESNGEN